ncbi:Cullin binding-domain-containing protein [Tribonema minus]|uniref:Defective in cullin neddylation protein n=1 Tax=Tribonema minus TaxID=303371 RepID=A0A836CDF2_9STRA|nr:Cullin binding-domain-containing protein [Tribonema minus]
MGIDPESDVSILVLCYKLKAQKPGQISQEEFVKGMTELRVDSVERLKQVLPSLDPGFMGQYEFRDFYRFVFTFSREGTKKTVEKDIVCALLPLVLPDSTRGQGATSQFVEFLEATDSVKIVTQDQWNSFLEYAKSVGTDIDRYDTDSSWPLLLDDFVSANFK